MGFQLLLFLFQLGFEFLDLVDGLGVVLVDLIHVVDTAYQVLETRGTEDHVQKRHGTGLVAGAHTAGQHHACRVQLDVGLVDLDLRKLDIVLGLLQLHGLLHERGLQRRQL